MYEEYDSFERLATGLSDAERQSILDQLNNSTKKHIDEEITPVETANEAEYISFPEQIKKEPFYLRIYIWLKSILTSSSKETIYNEHRLSLISKAVQKNYPGLIDTKRGLLLATFYNKLNELKSSAQFLRPYLAGIEDDEGAFYVILGSVVMNDVNSQITTEADPYTNPVSNSARPELRLELLHKMDAVLDNLPIDGKTKMYEAAKAAEWLRLFVKLPFTRFLSEFSDNSNEIYSCPYAGLSSEISTFARCLCNSFVVTDELLEAFYIFSRRKKSLHENSDEDEASQFLDKAHASIALIHMFMTSVPLKSLGCIIADDVNWKPQPFSGGEDWFVRYKAAWKKIFERKWEVWVKDCQIESLKINLKSNFGIDEFPSLPDRPWADLWGGQYFKYELTAGFLYWFMVKKFPDYEISLKTVLVEGDFTNKENQTAFTDAFNSFIQISISFQNLQQRCSPTGEIGMIFRKFSDEHLRTLSAQTKAEQLIRSVESDFESILHRFGDASRSLSKILAGILGIEKDSRYDSLANLNLLQGKYNAIFKSDLKKARTALEAALSLVKELEVLDNRQAKI